MCRVVTCRGWNIKCEDVNTVEKANHIPGDGGGVPDGVNGDSRPLQRTSTARVDLWTR